MLELSFVGAFVGLISGFFGVGGGTILVPLLLYLGFDTKIAMGISVVQMVFSSVYGSYLNNKKGTLDVKMVLFIGLGGFGGALLSGFVTSALTPQTLELIFLGFAIFALVRLFIKIDTKKIQKQVHPLLLLSIGFILGTISMTIGVGGSIVLTPILVGFLHIPLKKAISAGLFFVVFSSISGLISHALEGNIAYKSGFIIGLASLVGVYFGVYLKDRVNEKAQKNLLVSFYLLIVLYLAQRTLIS